MSGRRLVLATCCHGARGAIFRPSASAARGVTVARRLLRSGRRHSKDSLNEALVNVRCFGAVFKFRWVFKMAPAQELGQHVPEIENLGAKQPEAKVTINIPLFFTIFKMVFTS